MNKLQAYMIVHPLNDVPHMAVNMTNPRNMINASWTRPNLRPIQSPSKPTATWPTMIPMIWR